MTPSFLASVQLAAQGQQPRGLRAARAKPPAIVAGSDRDYRLSGGSWGRATTFSDPWGHTITLTRLGKGHATTAYLGEDGWVYLFTSDEARDPAKEVLESVVSRGKSRHLPNIELVGPSPRATVWRMPVYQKVTGEAAKQGRLLAKCASTAFTEASKGGWGAWNDRYQQALRYTEARNGTVACAARLARAGKLPGSVVTAIRRLAAATEDYSQSWLFEFPPRNVMQDAKGNLILLDVIFDQQAVIDYRRRQAAGRPR